MKKLLITGILCLMALISTAQQKSYWVFFTDKNDTQFDPYAYFDAKAIERYQHCGADLYDISNYPLNTSYVSTVDGYSDEVFGESRWLNAVGVTATEENALLIEQLPFVLRVQEIASQGTPAAIRNDNIDTIVSKYGTILSDQLIRFGGQHFIDKGIDGKGLRICVMDGGFPKVDTHPAFKHLRDNHQILMTYNFPNRREDVYGWSTHGTMVLSCIAGINDKGQKLGLATGAEFLLARTEIDPEPFKEEVWWAQGAEWADKNGADIINSSLGYGKDRHWTKDMDGSSYVAKAANLAAEKGILICNSAGNEGDDERWMTIITPADAENVLTVGGIDDNLKDYRHIYFSSYGPTADKRLKPNVCAYGHAKVANPSGGYTEASGTSFSSPLTAGFCACAWQTRRELTALQMKAEIEKSADLYPYFDYAFGYGVPQAAYFTDELTPAKRSFDLVQEKDGVRIVFPEANEDLYAFINVEDKDGVLLGYYRTTPSEGNQDIKLLNKDLGEGVKLNVSYKGFYDSCPISGMGGDISLMDSNKTLYGNDGTFKPVKKEGWQNTFFFDYDYNLAQQPWNGFSRHFAFGQRRMYGKTYKIGIGLGFDFNRFVAKGQIPNAEVATDRTTTIRCAQFRGELFQRIVMRRIGINWDLGAYGGVNFTRRVKVVDHQSWVTITDAPNGEARPQPYDDKVVTLYRNSRNINRFQYGATTRLSYSLPIGVSFGAYASYRLSDIIMGSDLLLGDPMSQPSPWSFGLEIGLGL
ncbi:MAG: S8 family serine peptidase [Bacteroidales bacterium]|nr:S8 family serine peptidase [Bacteroidales bacterium]